MAGLICSSRKWTFGVVAYNKFICKTANAQKRLLHVGVLTGPNIHQICRYARCNTHIRDSRSIKRYSIKESTMRHRMSYTLSCNKFSTVMLSSLPMYHDPSICKVPDHHIRPVQTRCSLHTSLSMLEYDAKCNGKELSESQEKNAESEESVSPENNQIVMSGTVSSDVTFQEKHQSPDNLPDNDIALSDMEDELDILAERNEPRIIEEFAEPPLMPSSYTLASYVEHSEVLQKLVDLGVDLSKVEKRQGVANELLRMTFDPHIKEKISFLHFVGVESDDLGSFLTQNPHILLEEQSNLEKRVQYLKSKKFTKAAIAQIVNRAPYFLCFSVERLDTRLGFYQQTLKLSGDELRQIVTACPKLVTHKIVRVKENMFVLKQQLGFHSNEVKTLALSHPKVLMRSKHKLISIFDYLHNDMRIPHKLILQNNQVFNDRAFKIQQRHQFLESVGRAQYDPTQAGYVSLKRMVTLPDDAFCQEFAKTTVEEYNSFLKTL